MENINGLRNRLAEEGHSEAGEEVWREQSIRPGFESAVCFIAKSKEKTTTEGSVPSEVCKFQKVSNPEEKWKFRQPTVTLERPVSKSKVDQCNEKFIGYCTKRRDLNLTAISRLSDCNRQTLASWLPGHKI